MTGEPLAEPSSAAADLEPTEVHATTSVEQPAPPAERFDAVTWGVLAIAAGAFLLRLLGLGIKAMHHDESLHATYSWYFAHAAPLYVHDPLMHGPFQFHAMAATFKIFGESDFTARIPAAMIGTLIVLTPLLLRRWLGGLGTLLAALLLALSPALLYYSRFAREDIHIALWTVLMVIAVWRYRDDGRDRWLVLLAAGLALGLATKESVYLTAAVLLLYLDVTLALALAAQRGGTGTVRLGDALTIAPFAWILAAFWSSIEPAREKWRFTTLPREGDLLIVIGILVLPQLAAAVQLPLHAIGITVDGEQERQLAIITVSALLGIAVTIGMSGDVRRWLLVAAVFYLITIPLFTTEFTNLRGGVASDFWGALDYWLEQQGVGRGEQPLLYYVMMVPLYEFLTLLPALIGGVWLLRRGDRLAALLCWWFAGTFVALSLAGEKMPWLVVHMALPLALIAALALSTAWREVRAHTRLPGASMRWTAIASAGVVAFVLLGALSVRTAVRVSFDHPDTAVEPLIYTQTSPDLPPLASRIVALSAASGGSLRIVVEETDGLSWPWAWYLRGLPGVSYVAASAVAATAATTTTDAVVIALPETIAAHPELSADREVVPYRHRWWFPEERYKTITLSEFMSGVVSGALPRDWATFVWSQIPVDRLGSFNAEVVFPDETVR